MAHACDYPSRKSWSSFYKKKTAGQRKDTTIDALVRGFLKRAYFWPALWTHASMRKAALEQYASFGLKPDQYDAIKASYDIFHSSGLEQPQKHGVPK
jgi:hypothetical protein